MLLYPIYANLAGFWRSLTRRSTRGGVGLERFCSRNRIAKLHKKPHVETGLQVASQNQLDYNKTHPAGFWQLLIRLTIFPSDCRPSRVWPERCTKWSVTSKTGSSWWRLLASQLGGTAARRSRWPRAPWIWRHILSTERLPWSWPIELLPLARPLQSSNGLAYDKETSKYT